MVITIRLVSPKVTKRLNPNLVSVLQTWKRSYIPPWTFLFHFLEILCIIFYCYGVIYPTIDGVYHTRKQLTDLLFPKQTDAPYAFVDDISDYFDDFLENLENFTKGSFSNMEFINQTRPVKFQINWENGSEIKYNQIDVNYELFRHVYSISAFTSFVIYSNETDVIGCTQWDINVAIYKPEGGYGFIPDPKISYSSCPSHYISDNREERKRISRKRIFIKHNVRNFRDVEIRYDPNRAATDKITIQNVLDCIKNKTLNKYIPPPIEPPKKTFNRGTLSLYNVMQRFGLMFLLISGMEFYLDSLNIWKLFSIHRKRLLVDSIYKELTLFDQFHTTIGFWNIFFFIKSVLVVILSLIVISDSSKISQYPSHRSMHIFGVASFIATSCALRWFIHWPKVYRLTLLFVNGIRRIVINLASQSIILLSLMLATVFLFGFVAQKAESFIDLLKLFISMIFGDSLYPTYTEFSDGSFEYNLMSFIFNSFLIMVLIWIFFTANTAIMTWVDHHIISQLTQ